MSEQKPVLYFFSECGYCQRVLGTMTNFKARDHFTLKNIRENADYEKELVDLCGDTQVPTLVADGKPMRESEAIIGWLADKYAP